MSWFHVICGFLYTCGTREQFRAGVALILAGAMLYAVRSIYGW